MVEGAILVSAEKHLNSFIFQLFSLMPFGAQGVHLSLVCLGLFVLKCYIKIGVHWVFDCPEIESKVLEGDFYLNSRCRTSFIITRCDHQGKLWRNCHGSQSRQCDGMHPGFKKLQRRKTVQALVFKAKNLGWLCWWSGLDMVKELVGSKLEEFIFCM